MAQGVPGSPVVDYLGRLTGVWSGGTSAIPAPNAAALFDIARRNIATQQTLAVNEVSRRENHIFGALAVTADLPGASVRLIGLERLHWAAITAGATGPAPFNFSGPIGRYRLETSAPGVTARTQEVVIRAGETIRIGVPLRAVASAPLGGPPPAAVKKGGIPKWVWFAVIGGAAGAAALGGGGGGSGGGGGATTGSINLSIPVNPP